MPLSKITSNALHDSAVTSAKIVDGAVVETDIANNAVTSPKIADLAVTLAKIGYTGAILQVVNGTGQASSVSMSGTSRVASGVKVVITPVRATSRILILGWLHVYKSSGIHFNAAVHRNGSDLIGGSGVGGSDNDGGTAHYDAPMVFLDSPNTTSATTYEWYLWSRDSGTGLGVNDGGSYRSGIVAIEVA